MVKRKAGEMKTTAKAQTVIDTLRGMYSAAVVSSVLVIAEAVAKRDGSRVLGKNHVMDAIDIAAQEKGRVRDG